MMKNFLICIVVLAAITVAASSCKRCVTCEYSYEWLGDTITTSFAEECGSNADIDDFIDAKDAEAKRYGTTITCIDSE